ncbi:hypothetical protein FNF29_02203 [Cafeteria roenbergensis]|uniref:Uncharacterized protein n=1 Tax=Cafeteria roenbergensis TaxID=33653 RepID=A0A5A8CNH7_CAFRO|nr:hypothetical protein FNF29_02203 [Cafeteria roenbergensis]|eukprot:KAA0154673.1 hypothetical protein FNF29_02203 [Cafeteria roenbergensis]
MASRGPSGDEIDDFLTRVNSATDKIQALVSGKMDAEDLEGLDEDGIRIKSDRTSLARPASGAAATGAGRPKVEMLDDDEPAEETPEEKKARLGRQADVLWDDAQHRKAQEHSRWWRFAHLQFDKDEEAEAAASAAAEAMAGATGVPSAKPGMVVKTADGRTLRTGADGKARGADIDYSRWDKWVEAPDDPATKEELEALEKEKEAARDRAFEEANPAFVKGFLGDMEKRKASRAEKLRRAGEHKTKGNGFFKAGEARRAAGHYHAAVELDPFAEALHTNLAAAYLRMGDWAAAEEHGSRAIIVAGEAGSAKGLFRRGIARRGLGDWAGAAADLAAAAAMKGATADVKTEAALAEAALAEVTAERDSAVVAAAAAALKASGLPDRAGKPVTSAPALPSGEAVHPAIAAALAACDSSAVSTSPSSGSSAASGDAAGAPAGSAPAKQAIAALKGLSDLLADETADEASRLSSCRLVRATGLLSAVSAGLVSATSLAIATAAHTTEPDISPAVLTAALAACDIVTAAASPALAMASKAAAAASKALTAGRVPEAAAAAAGMPPADRPADAGLALGIVPALCRLVAALFARSLLDKEALAGPVGERATAALAALSAHEVARPAFAVRVGRGGASSSSPAAAAAASAAVSAATADRPAPAAPPSISSSPALRPLLDLLRLPLDPSPAWDVVRGNALAALSNAALGTATTARAVVDSGAVRSLLDFLDGRAVLPEAAAAAQSGAASAGAAVDRLLAIAGGAAPGQAIDLGVPGPGLRGRAAALLSRLAADETGARLLAEPANVARMTILLARCAADGSTGEAGADVDSARTQDALLRCLAGAVSVPAARAEFVRAGGIRAMGAVLTRRGGEAATRARANGLGNLARAAIQLAGAPGAAGAAMCAEMCRQDVLDGLLGVVKQVGAHPARKNAAVALARLAKGHPSCSERLRELDGVKVLLSLGSELR